MRFEYKHKGFVDLDDGYDAIKLLEEAYKNNKLNEIENMGDIIDCLETIFSRHEDALKRLHEYNLDL